MLFHGIQGSGGYLTPYSGSATASLTAFANSGTTASSFTFSSQSIGAAATGRRVLVGVTIRRSTGVAGDISSVTVGGTSATLVPSSKIQYSSTRASTAWYIIQVDTGTTATIVVNANGSSSACAIVVYRLLGFSSYSTQTVQTTSTLSNRTLTTTQNIPANVFIFANAFAVAPTPANFSSFWYNIYETVDDSLSNNHTSTSAIVSRGSANSSYSLSVRFSANINAGEAGMSVVSFS